MISNSIPLAYCNRRPCLETNPCPVMPKGQQNCWCHLPGRKRLWMWNCRLLIYCAADTKNSFEIWFCYGPSNCSSLFDKHSCIFVELSRPVSCLVSVGIIALTKQVQWLHQLKRWHMTPPCVSLSGLIPCQTTIAGSLLGVASSTLLSIVNPIMAYSIPYFAWNKTWPILTNN